METNDWMDNDEKEENLVSIDEIRDELHEDIDSIQENPYRAFLGNPTRLREWTEVAMDSTMDANQFPEANRFTQFIPATRNRALGIALMDILTILNTISSTNRWMEERNQIEKYIDLIFDKGGQPNKNDILACISRLLVNASQQQSQSQNDESEVWNQLRDVMAIETFLQFCASQNSSDGKESFLQGPLNAMRKLERCFELPTNAMLSSFNIGQVVREGFAHGKSILDFAADLQMYLRTRSHLLVPVAYLLTQASQPTLQSYLELYRHLWPQSSSDSNGILPKQMDPLDIIHQHSHPFPIHVGSMSIMNVHNISAIKDAFQDVSLLGPKSWFAIACALLLAFTTISCLSNENYSSPIYEISTAAGLLTAVMDPIAAHGFTERSAIVQGMMFDKIIQHKTQPSTVLTTAEAESAYLQFLSHCATEDIVCLTNQVNSIHGAKTVIQIHGSTQQERTWQSVFLTSVYGEKYIHQTLVDATTQYMGQLTNIIKNGLGYNDIVDPTRRYERILLDTIETENLPDWNVFDEFFRTVRPSVVTEEKNSKSKSNSIHNNNNHESGTTTIFDTISYFWDACLGRSLQSAVRITNRVAGSLPDHLHEMQSVFVSAVSIAQKARLEVFSGNNILHLLSVRVIQALKPFFEQIEIRIPIPQKENGSIPITALEQYAKQVTLKTIEELKKRKGKTNLSNADYFVATVNGVRMTIEASLDDTKLFGRRGQKVPTKDNHDKQQMRQRFEQYHSGIYILHQFDKLETIYNDELVVCDAPAILRIIQKAISAIPTQSYFSSPEITELDILWGIMSVYYQYTKDGIHQGIYELFLAFEEGTILPTVEQGPLNTLYSSMIRSNQKSSITKGPNRFSPEKLEEGIGHIQAQHLTTAAITVTATEILAYTIPRFVIQTLLHTRQEATESHSQYLRYTSRALTILTLYRGARSVYHAWTQGIGQYGKFLYQTFTASRGIPVQASSHVLDGLGTYGYLLLSAATLPSILRIIASGLRYRYRSSLETAPKLVAYGFAASSVQNSLATSFDASALLFMGALTVLSSNVISDQSIDNRLKILVSQYQSWISTWMAPAALSILSPMCNLFLFLTQNPDTSTLSTLPSLFMGTPSVRHMDEVGMDAAELFALGGCAMLLGFVMKTTHVFTDYITASIDRITAQAYLKQLKKYVDEHEVQNVIDEQFTGITMEWTDVLAVYRKSERLGEHPVLYHFSQLVDSLTALFSNMTLSQRSEIIQSMTKELQNNGDDRNNEAFQHAVQLSILANKRRWYERNTLLWRRCVTGLLASASRMCYLFYREEYRKAIIDSINVVKRLDPSGDLYHTFVDSKPFEIPSISLSRRTTTYLSHFASLLCTLAGVSGTTVDTIIATCADPPRLQSNFRNVLLTFGVISYQYLPETYKFNFSTTTTHHDTIVKAATSIGGGILVHLGYKLYTDYDKIWKRIQSLYPGHTKWGSVTALSIPRTNPIAPPLFRSKPLRFGMDYLSSGIPFNELTDRREELFQSVYNVESRLTMPMEGIVIGRDLSMNGSTIFSWMSTILFSLAQGLEQTQYDPRTNPIRSIVPIFFAISAGMREYMNQIISPFLPGMDINTNLIPSVFQYNPSFVQNQFPNRR